MPASSIDSYLQDARKKFDAVRPATICTDTNQSMGQCQNVHISTNCYYGYHDLKNAENNHVDTDCEMVELEVVLANRTQSKTTSRKRSADEEDFPQRKRLREDVSSMCSLVGTRSSPSHSASAFNVNISTDYRLFLTYRLVFSVHVLYD